MKLSVACVFSLVLAACINVEAWEYPRTPLRTSLEKGRLAFRGRVLALRQTKRDQATTRAVATIRVSECLYGDCSAGRAVEIEYLAQSLLEEVDPCFGYPTSIPVGADVVFVFAKPPRSRGRLTFNTCLQKEGVASAYVLSDEPDGWPPHTPDDREDAFGRYQSIYGARDETPLLQADVAEIAARRRKELQ